MHLVYQRIHQKPQSPKVRNPEIPEYLSRIILKCLETDPADRYQNAREVLSDLESEVAPPPPGSMQITLPFFSRRVWLDVGQHRPGSYPYGPDHPSSAPVRPPSNDEVGGQHGVHGCAVSGHG